MIQNAIDITKLERPIVAIVAFASQIEVSEHGHGYHLPHYQVTIDPKALSPTQEFIRMGEVPGDEITGWQPVNEIVVEEVVAEYDLPVPRLNDLRGLKMLEWLGAGMPALGPRKLEAA